MAKTAVTNFGYNSGAFQSAPSARPVSQTKKICKRCKKEICSCPHGCRCKTPQV